MVTKQERRFCKLSRTHQAQLRRTGKILMRYDVESGIKCGTACVLSENVKSCLLIRIQVGYSIVTPQAHWCFKLIMPKFIKGTFRSVLPLA
jgi:hypothetical protein